MRQIKSSFLVVLLLILPLFASCATNRNDFSEFKCSTSLSLLPVSDTSAQSATSAKPNKVSIEEGEASSSTKESTKEDEYYYVGDRYQVLKNWGQATDLLWKPPDSLGATADLFTNGYPISSGFSICKGDREGCNQYYELLNDKYLIGLIKTQKYNYGYSNINKKPQPLVHFDCFIFCDGKFYRQEFDILYCDAEDNMKDLISKITFDPVTTEATFKTFVTTVTVNMDTGEKKSVFSTKNYQERKADIFDSVSKIFAYTTDNKYSLGFIEVSLQFLVVFSRNNETGEEHFIVQGEIPPEKIAADVTIDGYNASFEKWRCSFDLETGERVY